jgi:hypothetical protein
MWILVFGFATLNILGLVSRRFEHRRRGLNFGEIMAISVVVGSVLLLGMEMLNMFHILPMKLTSPLNLSFLSGAGGYRFDSLLAHSDFLVWQKGNQRRQNQAQMLAANFAGTTRRSTPEDTISRH